MTDAPDPQPESSDGALSLSGVEADVMVVVEEPGRAPLRLLLTRQILEVGRDCAGLLLTDPQVSRRHLAMRSTRGGVEVKDLGSANGTFAGDVALSGPRLLHEGDSVRLGTTTVRVLGGLGAHGFGGRRLQAEATSARATSIDLVAAAALDAPRPDLHLLAGDGGTLTIVFSDIERSTDRTLQLGDERWLELLNVHNTIVRRHVHRQGGTEVKAQGDGFLLSFPSARRGLRAMVDVQRALAAHARSKPADALRVRVGIHTGEVIIAEGDVFGRHVVLASRIADRARGGEILVSSLVRELLEPHDEFHFAEPRGVELKGIQGSHTVHPVQWSRSTLG